MGTSYGLVEVSGVVAAIDSLDAMCKASDVSLVTWERKLGGRLVTLIVEGGVSDVKAAVDAAKNICEENKHILAASGVIAAPSEEIRKMVALSARRIQKKREQEAQAEAAVAAEANAADTAGAEPAAGGNDAKTAEASDETAEVKNASEAIGTEADTTDATNTGETGANAADTAESAGSEAKADNTGKPADQAKKNHRKK